MRVDHDVSRSPCVWVIAALDQLWVITGLTVHVFLRDVLRPDERGQPPHVAPEHALVHGVRAVSLAVVLLRAGAEDLVVSAAEDLAAPVGFDRPGGRRLLVRF